MTVCRMNVHGLKNDIICDDFAMAASKTIVFAMSLHPRSQNMTACATNVFTSLTSNIIVLHIYYDFSPSVSNAAVFVMIVFNTGFKHNLIYHEAAPSI